MKGDRGRREIEDAIRGISKERKMTKVECEGRMRMKEGRR